MIDKNTELLYKNEVRVALKEAKSTPNYKEAISNLNEVLSVIPTELTEQRTKVESAISEIQEKMEVQLKDAEKALKEHEVSHSDLKAKYESQNILIKELQEKLEKASKLIEGTEDSSKLNESVSKLSEELSKVKASAKKMYADIKMYQEYISKRKDIYAVSKMNEKLMSEDIEKFKEKCKIFYTDIKFYEKALSRAEAHVTSCEKVLKEEFNYEFAGDETDELINDDIYDIDAEGDFEIPFTEDDEIIDDVNEDEGELETYSFDESDDNDEDTGDDKEEIKEDDDSEEDNEDDLEESDDEDDENNK